MSSEEPFAEHGALLMQPPMKVWVLWHRYHDWSGAHIERVYLSRSRADSDLALLTEGQAGKQVDGVWTVDQLEITR